MPRGAGKHFRVKGDTASRVLTGSAVAYGLTCMFRARIRSATTLCSRGIPVDSPMVPGGSPRPNRRPDAFSSAPGRRVIVLGKVGGLARQPSRDSAARRALSCKLRSQYCFRISIAFSIQSATLSAMWLYT